MAFQGKPFAINYIRNCYLSYLTKITLSFILHENIFLMRNPSELNRGDLMNEQKLENCVQFPKDQLVLNDNNGEQLFQPYSPFCKVIFCESYVVSG